MEAKSKQNGLEQGLKRRYDFLSHELVYVQESVVGVPIADWPRLLKDYVESMFCIEVDTRVRRNDAKPRDYHLTLQWPRVDHFLVDSPLFGGHIYSTVVQGGQDQDQLSVLVKVPKFIEEPEGMVFVGLPTLARVEWFELPEDIPHGRDDEYFTLAGCRVALYENVVRLSSHVGVDCGFERVQMVLRSTKPQSDTAHSFRWTEAIYG